MPITSVKFIVSKENLIKTELIAYNNVTIGLIDFIKSNNKEIPIERVQSFLVVTQFLQNKEWNMKKPVLEPSYKSKIMSVCSIICSTKKFNNVHQRKNDIQLMIYFYQSFLLYLKQKNIFTKNQYFIHNPNLHLQLLHLHTLNINLILPHQNQKSFFSYWIFFQLIF